MITPVDAWIALQRLQAALATQYSAEFRAAVMEQGLGREPVGVLLLAANVDPRPVSAGSLAACLAYYAETAFTSRLERLVAGGWMETDGAGYTLSLKGRAAVTALHVPVRERLAALAPMPPADLERLADLLERLFAACRASPEVAEQGCVAASGNAGPSAPTGPSPLARAARAIDALANFRCDAHRAAWQPLAASGPAWEVLTWLWQDRAASAPSLQAWAEKQPFPRGFSVDDYARFLHELAARGWAALRSGDEWELTPAGRQAREAAEAQTDTLFYAPWSILADAELQELTGRAEVVRESLGAAREA